MMPSFFRSSLALLCCALVACVNPYLAQMDVLEADYRAGRISREEYYREMDSLTARSRAWSAQNQANVALGAAAIGAAATVGGALIEAEAHEDVAHAISSSHDHHHKGGDGHSKKGGGGSKKGGSKKGDGDKPKPQGDGPPQGSKPPR